jgi:hypothetical protein
MLMSRMGTAVGVVTLAFVVAVGTAHVGHLSARDSALLRLATTVLFVDANASPSGDGSARFPFRDLQDAIAAAALTAGPVVIRVRPGDYVVTESLIVERSSIELRGSTKIVQDADGWPTGEIVPGTETRIVAANPSGSQSLFVFGRPETGSLQNDVTVRGFIFNGAIGGSEVLLNRVQTYRIEENIFATPAFAGLWSVASSGLATGNYASGVGVGLTFNGGYAESPSNVVVTGNRSVRNRSGGLLLVGASNNIPELGDELNAVVRGNDLSNNSANPTFSFGFRIFILQRVPGAPGDSQSSARIDARVQGNRIVGNALGVTLDAGFPYRVFNGVCDPRVFSGDINVTLIGNTVAGSLLTQSLVTFTRNTTALNPAQLPLYQYLHNATFTIEDRDGALATALIDHPASDPFLGPCPGDATHEPLGNTLIYNNLVVPSGRNF